MIRAPSSTSAPPDDKSAVPASTSLLDRHFNALISCVDARTSSASTCARRCTSALWRDRTAAATIASTTNTDIRPTATHRATPRPPGDEHPTSNGASSRPVIEPNADHTRSAYRSTTRSGHRVGPSANPLFQASRSTRPPASVVLTASNAEDNGSANRFEGQLATAKRRFSPDVAKHPRRSITPLDNEYYV